MTIPVNTELILTSTTPDTEVVAPHLSPENLAVLGGISLQMLREAELALQEASPRTQKHFDQVLQLREIVGAYGWQ